MAERGSPRCGIYAVNTDYASIQENVVEEKKGLPTRLTVNTTSLFQISMPKILGIKELKN